MDIQLNNLLPLPIKERDTGHSEIWGTDLYLESGRKYFVEAPSGSGKSTFVHILYGLRKDYTGSVCWNGREIKTIHEATWAAWRAEKISIIFQDLRLFPDLTVEENLQIKQTLFPDLSMATLHSWAGEMGMASKWMQPAGTLSHGEQQRVAILRGLIQPSQWLLMDEPFSHLDENNTRIAREMISARVDTLGAGIIWLDLERTSSLMNMHLLRL